MFGSVKQEWKIGCGIAVLAVGCVVPALAQREEQQVQLHVVVKPQEEVRQPFTLGITFQPLRYSASGEILLSDAESLFVAYDPAQSARDASFDFPLQTLVSYQVLVEVFDAQGNPSDDVYVYADLATDGERTLKLEAGATSELELVMRKETRSKQKANFLDVYPSPDAPGIYLMALYFSEDQVFEELTGSGGTAP